MGTNTLLHYNYDYSVLGRRQAKASAMPWRGEFAALLTLALCWAATLSASCLLVSIAPLAAKRLGASKTLAPFTCGTFLLGAAVVSAPSAPLFRALGRRGAFVSGAGVGVLGGILGTLATIYRLHASLLFAACALVGLDRVWVSFTACSA